MRKLRFVVSLTVVLAMILFASFARNVSAQTPQGPAQSDHALMGTGESIYCGVAPGKGAEPFTLHVAGSAPATAGTLTITFGDLSSIVFSVPPQGSFSMTQELGGVPGVDDIVQITMGGGATDAMASVKVRAGVKDPFAGDNELDNFCLTTGDPGTP